MTEEQKKSHVREKIFLILILCWTAVIWGHSLQPAGISTQESGGVIEMLIPFLEAVRIPPRLYQLVVRKTAHFLEFFIVGALWTGFLQKKKAWMPLAAGVVTAVIDETIQLFVEGRSGQLQDVLLDSSGVLFAVVLLSAFSVLRKNRKEKKSQKTPL